MSSSSEAAYLSLKRSRSNLLRLEDELHGVAYENLAPRRSTFTDLESCMRMLCSNPEIAALAEASDVLNISKEAMSYGGFSSGRKLKTAAAYVLQRFDSIKERTKYVTERSKPHAAGNRDAVLGLVRRSAAITGSGFRLETGSPNPIIDIMNKYSELSSNTAGILRELEIVDSISSYEDEYLELTRVLQESVDAFNMIVSMEKASKIMTLLSSLMAAKKVEYGISDDEAGYIPELEEARSELEQAREEVKKYKSVSRMLLEQLDAKERKPALVPFDLESFEESLFKLTKQATRATAKVDGKKMVTTSEGGMKLIFNELNTKLEGTQFSILGARTQDLLDNMHDIVKDPDFLERAIGDYTTLAELVIDNYRLRTKRKSEMAALL